MEYLGTVRLAEYGLIDGLADLPLVDIKCRDNPDVSGPVSAELIMHEAGNLLEFLPAFPPVIFYPLYKRTCAVPYPRNRYTDFFHA
jgi:hypothetical protein